CEKSSEESPASYVSRTSVTNLKKHFEKHHNEKWKEIESQYQMMKSSKKSRLSVNDQETLDVSTNHTGSPNLSTNMESPSRLENVESSSVSNMSIFDVEIKKYTIKNIKNIKRVNIKGITQKNIKELYLETEDEIEIERKNNNVRFLNVPVEKEINKYTIRNFKKVIIDDIIHECNFHLFSLELSSSFGLLGGYFLGYNFYLFSLKLSFQFGFL
ncbi:17435_t:CDS:2, partial [Dentiscutata heterogama]